MLKYPLQLLRSGFELAGLNVQLSKLHSSKMSIGGIGEFGLQLVRDKVGR